MADVTSIARTAQKRRNIQHILESSSRTGAATAWLGQLEDLTRDLQPSSAGDILYQMAQQYHRAGRTALAADVLSMLVEQYPNHPLTGGALLWLMRYYVSSEVAWCTAHESQFHTGGVAALPVSGQEGTGGRAQQAGYTAAANPLVTAGGESQLSDATAGPTSRDRQRWAKVLALGQQVRQTRPALYPSPQIALPLAAALRAGGQIRDGEQVLEGLAGGTRADAWQLCAQSELWLTRGTAAPPKPIYQCVAAASKPRLDGRLDDPLWQAAQRMTLTSPLRDDSTWPAVVLMAHDTQYLYLAADCQKAAAAQYSPPPAQPRSRDADLKNSDRVDLLIDLDRDYATYFQLSVDYRGWTRDCCWDDASWDPQWYVAVADDGPTWTLEAAISLADVAPPWLPVQAAWAVGVQRTVPNVGFQSWTRPAQVQGRGDGFGLLVRQ